MRGLLIKDFKLMKCQKNFFFVIVATAIVMAMFWKDLSFIIGYMTFIGSLFTLSTISYDEFDNGNAFLFSLPITRKNYIVEKYGFGLLIGGSSWLLSTIFAATVGLMKNSILLTDALMMLPVFLILLAIMLPFQFKFGGEKSRVAMIVAFGLLFVIAFIVVKIAGLFDIDLITLFNQLPTMNMGMMTAATFGIAMITLLLSFKISVAIMKKKEF